MIDSLGNSSAGEIFFDHLDCDEQTIQQMLLNQAELAIAFFRKSENQVLLQILKKIGSECSGINLDLNNTAYNLLWLGYIVANSVVSEHIEPSQGFFLHSIMNVSEDRTTTTIHKILSFPKDIAIPPKYEIQFLKELMIFRKSQPGFFYSLLPTISEKLLKFNIDNLVKEYQLNLIHYFPNLPIEVALSFPADKIDKNNIRNVLSDLLIIENTSVQKSLHTLFSVLKRFPDTKVFYELPGTSPKYSIRAALANECISRNTHFVDVLKREINYNLATDRISPQLKNELPFKKVWPVFFLSKYSDYMKDPVIYEKYLGYFRGMCPVFNELFDRLRNDLMLPPQISMYSDNKLFLSDFRINSIPYFVKMSLPIINISNLSKQIDHKYFIVSDENLLHDMSFIAAFQMMYSILKFISTDGSLDVSAIRPFITCEDIKESLVLDLFSLMFLTDEKGEFVCNMNQFETILQLVMEIQGQCYIHVAYDYINTARIRLVFSQIVHLKELKETMVPPETTILNALKQKKYEVALKMACYSKKAETKVSLLLAMLGNRVENANRFLLALERYLSKGEDSFLLNYEIHEENQEREQALKLICDKYLNTFKEEVYIILKLHRSREDNFSIISRNNLVKSQFQNFTELCENRNIDLSNVSPLTAIQQLIESDIFLNQDQVNAVLGFKGIELILFFSNQLQVTPHMHEMIKKYFPLAARALQTQKYLTETIEYGDTVYDKYLMRLHGNEKDETIIGTYERNIDEDNDVSDDEFRELIDQAINSRTFSIESYDDLYYRNPIIFVEHMKQNIDKFSVSDIIQVYPFCEMRTLHLFEKYGFKKIDFEALVPELLQDQQFHSLYKVMCEFNLKLHIVQQIQNYFDLHSDLRYPKLRAKIIKYKGIIRNTQVTKKHISQDVFESYFKDATGPQSYASATRKLAIEIFPNYEISPSMITFMVNKLKIIVSQLNIKNSQMETVTFSSLSRILKIINKSGLTISPDNQSIIDKIVIISRILYHRFYTQYHVDLDFRKFLSPDFGEMIAGLALQYDFTQLMIDICVFYRLEYFSFEIDRANIAFSLGLISIGDSILPDKAPSALQFQKMYDTLTHESVFDLSQFSLDKKFSTYQRIKDILAKDYGPICRTLEDQCVKSTITKISDKNERIWTSMSLGDFVDAFQVWTTINEYQSRLDTLIRLIMGSAVVFSNWNQLWRFLKKQMNDIKPLLNDLFKFLHQNRMIHTHFYIANTLHIFGQAIAPAIDISAQTHSWQNRLHWTTTVERVVAKTIEEEGKSNEREKELMRVKLQTKMIEYCIENDITFDQRYELLRSKDHAVFVGVQMMKLGNCEFVIDDLINPISCSLMMICEVLAQELIKENGLPKFFKQINKLPEDKYDIIVMTMFNSMQVLIHDPKVLKSFVDQNIKDVCKGRLYFSLGFLNEAFAMAQKKKDRELLEMICDSAINTNNQVLQAKCEKLLK